MFQSFIAGFNSAATTVLTLYHTVR